MKRIIEYFDHVYIINLISRPDRKIDTIKEFKRINIHIPNNNIEFYHAVKPENRGNYRTNGARGIHFSHRSIFEDAIKNRYNKVLIFEDDVLFKRNITNEHENKIIKDLDLLNWDIVMFGYLMPKKKIDGFGIVPYPDITRGTHFYGIDLRFMDRIVPYMYECEKRPPGHPLGGPMSRDAVVNHFRLLNSDVQFYISTTNLAVQRSSRTDLGTDGVLDKFKPASVLVNLLRKLKNFAIRMYIYIK